MGFLTRLHGKGMLHFYVGWIRSDRKSAALYVGWIRSDRKLSVDLGRVVGFRTS
jgi:hypothetical protein